MSLRDMGHPKFRMWATRQSEQRPFWQARYYDFNVYSEKKRIEKLRYMHRNPVKRGLVERPYDWRWSSFRHYLTGEVGVVEIESEMDGYLEGSHGRTHEIMGAPHLEEMWVCRMSDPMSLQDMGHPRLAPKLDLGHPPIHASQSGKAWVGGETV